MNGGKAGKTSGRTVKRHSEARAALSVWLEVLTGRLHGAVDPSTPIFCSRVKDPTTGLKRAISREQAWRILKEAFNSNELEGKLGTHAMRKTFANRIYHQSNRDLIKTQQAMGHKHVNSTQHYLSFLQDEIDALILAI